MLLMLNLATPGAGFAAQHPTQAVDTVLLSSLHLNPVWQALLHANQNQNRINDPAFLLSLPDFSLQQELSLNLEQLFMSEDRQDRWCRFPARTFWLAQQLGWPLPDLQHCKGLQEFMVRAPMDDLYLVYASENLTQPSSMMGHILLKLEGEKPDGRKAEHAISFFTELQGINVPKIIYDSLIAGKTGYYALSPYSEKRDYYLQLEQRNVWEYRIKLTDAQKQLVQYHLWELKETQLTYLFTTYNCATLTHFILSLIAPEMLADDANWLSPLDVVKAAERNQLIDSIQVYPSDKWAIRMLQDADSSLDAAQLKRVVDAEQWDEVAGAGLREQQFVRTELARAYLGFQGKQGLANEILPQSSGEFILDLTEYKIPTKAPADSQLYSGVVRIDDDDYIRVGYLPAAHYLHDDNEQYFSENELRLAELSLLIAPESGAVRLDEFQFYSMTSLVPYDRFTGGLSGRFAFGVEPHFDDALTRKQSGYIKGDLGLAFQPHNDVLLYGLAGAGAGVRSDTSYLYGEVELGVVINEIYDMKTTVSVGRVFNQLASKKPRNEIMLTHAKRITDAWTLVFDYELKRNSLVDFPQCQLTLHYLY